MDVCDSCGVAVTCGVDARGYCCKCEGVPCAKRLAVEAQRKTFLSVPAPILEKASLAFSPLLSVGELILLPSNSILVAADGQLWERFYDGLFYQPGKRRGMKPEFFGPSHYPFKIVHVPSHGRSRF